MIGLFFLLCACSFRLKGCLGRSAIILDRDLWLLYLRLMLILQDHRKRCVSFSTSSTLARSIGRGSKKENLLKTKGIV